MFVYGCTLLCTFGVFVQPTTATQTTFFPRKARVTKGWPAHASLLPSWQLISWSRFKNRRKKNCSFSKTFVALKMEDCLHCTVQNLGLKTPVQITNPEEKSKNPCLLNEKRSTAILLFATSVTPAGQEDKTKNSNPFFQSGQSPLSLSLCPLLHRWNIWRRKKCVTFWRCQDYGWILWGTRQRNQLLLEISCKSACLKLQYLALLQYLPHLPPSVSNSCCGENLAEKVPTEN